MTYLKLSPVGFLCFLQFVSPFRLEAVRTPARSTPCDPSDLRLWRRVCLQVCKMISSKNRVSPIFRGDWNRKTLILLEDRFVCCSNFSATYSGNHAMFCVNSTSHLNKIKMSPEILNKCSIKFCRPSSLSSVCSQNTAGPNIDFVIKIYMIRMCIYIYIHIRNHCSLLYETFSLKK